MKKPIMYYVSGHTAQGSINYFHENAHGIHQVIVLKHEHPQIISIILQAIMHKQNPEKAEVILDPYGAGTIGGVLYRDRGVAYASASLITKRVPEMDYTDVDLSVHTPLLPLQVDQEMITEAFEKSYAAFHNGLEIHDELEAIYVNAMDFQLADETAETFIQRLFPNEMTTETTSNPLVYRRLFGTNTLSGVENVVSDLLHPLRHRVYIKGRAGTGKSVFMKKVWEACSASGLDVEVYHCSFDPDSIDMLIVRALDFCIFDSTSPHEFFPDRKDDEVIDLYTRTVTEGTDERYADEISRLTRAYKAEMKQGIDYLIAAKTLYPSILKQIPVQEIMHQLEKNGILK